MSQGIQITYTRTVVLPGTPTQATAIEAALTGAADGSPKVEVLRKYNFFNAAAALTCNEDASIENVNFSITVTPAI